MLVAIRFFIFKYHSMHKLLIIFTLSAIAQVSFAQNRLLSINEMFAIADTVESSLKASKLNTAAASELVNDGKSARRPDINISLSVGYLGNGYIWDRDFSDGMSVDIPHFGTNFALEIQQVLYAGGAINKSIALSEKNKQMAELEYETNRQQVHFSLVGNYLNLYKAINQIDVYNQNILLVEKLIENLNAKKEQGTILQNALTRYELQLENLKLQRRRLENSIQIFNHQLVTALKLDNSTEIIPDTTLLGKLIEIGHEEDWQQQATENSPILQQSAMGVEMSSLSCDLELSSRRPTIALIAQDHLDGPVTIEIPALNKNFNYWFVGIGINYNLSSLYKNNNRVRAAKLNMAQSEERENVAKEHISNAIQESYIRLNEAYNEVEVQTKNLELARLNYNVINNRYINDLALLTDMLDASNSILTAELDLKNAQINLLFIYLKLNYLCGKI